MSALLPVAQGVADLAALSRAADSAKAAGDGRTRGQVMADELVRRVTGHSEADDVPVEIQLVMTDAALFAGDAEPADVPGFGPVPAPMARSWIRGDARRSNDDAARDEPVSADSENRPQGLTSTTLGADSAAAEQGGGQTAEARRWLRRLYADPETGELVAMDSKQRCFPEPLRRFLVARDQVCRMPWCEAPIRHADHVVPFADAGATSLDNGQGLCEACNHAKQAPVWTSIRHADGSITVTTPSGKTYSSQPRPLPGGWRTRARQRGRSPT